MKKYICTVMLVLMSIGFTHAQRMLPKQKGIEIGAGILSGKESFQEYYLKIGMTVNGKNGNYELWVFEYTHEYYKYRDIDIPLETYTAEGGYSFYLLGDTRRNIALNAGVTAVAGYETVNRGKVILYDGAKIRSEEGFIYGGGVHLSLETYLSDRFVFLVQGRAKILWGTSLEQFRPSAGLGLRYNL